MAQQTKSRSTKLTEPAVAGDPGYGLGIAGFITSFFSGIAGWIISAVALSQSRQAGKKNGFAFAGLIIGIVKTVLEVLTVIAIVALVVWATNYCSDNPAQCEDPQMMQQGRYWDDEMVPERTY